MANWCVGKLFSLSLLCDSFLFALELLRISEIVILYEVEIVIELEDVRSGCRDVQADNVSVRDSLEVLYDTTEAVAVGHNHDVVVLLEGWEDLALPVRHNTLDAVLKSFCARNVLVWNESVARILGSAVRIVLRKVVRSHVEAAAPDEHLLVTVLLGGLGLVQTLKHSVMLLVEPPGLLYRDPVEIHSVEDVVEGLDGSLKVRGVGHLEGDSGLFEGLSGVEGFLYALLAEVNVGPSCEPVLLVPLALAVTDKYYSFHIPKNFGLFQLPGH